MPWLPTEVRVLATGALRTLDDVVEASSLVSTAANCLVAFTERRDEDGTSPPFPRRVLRLKQTDCPLDHYEAPVSMAISQPIGAEIREERPLPDSHFSRSVSSFFQSVFLRWTRGAWG